MVQVPWWSSLRMRLVLLVALAMIPALGLILYTAFEERQHVGLTMQETALRLARVAASNQGQLAIGTHHLLVGLAELPEVGTHDAVGCSALFARLAKKHTLYANLGAIKPDGELFCSALPFKAPINLGDRSYFRHAIATREFAVGEYQIGRATGRTSINFGYPAMDAGGEVRAVVFAALDLQWLNSLIAEAQLPPGSSFTVLDQNGTILARAPDPERWVGQAIPPDGLAAMRNRRTGAAEADGIDGVRRFFGFTPLFDRQEGGDVLIRIGIPRDTVLAAVNQNLRRNLFWFGAVVVFAFIATWVGGSALVVRRVTALVAGARRISAGDLGARTGLRYGHAELDEVARAFDEMAASLEAREAERQRTEQELRQQREALFKNERLADLGRLAAGVAHELRNPLTVVTARIELMRRQVTQGHLEGSELFDKHVERLEEASARMTRIMEGLSTYARPPKTEPQLLDLGQLMDATRELLEYKARQQKVTIGVEVPAEPPRTRGDRSQFMQILVNLANNAIEAMAGSGGTLTLRARLSGAHVVIEVADTGPGVPPDALERIWEAFYTTKAEGTGLGLSIVRALVQEQSGTITVESRPGIGTTFRVSMPAAAQADECSRGGDVSAALHRDG